MTNRPEALPEALLDDVRGGAEVPFFSRTLFGVREGDPRAAAGAITKIWGDPHGTEKGATRQD